MHKNLLLSLCLVYIVMIFDSFVFTNRKQNPVILLFFFVLLPLLLLFDIINSHETVYMMGRKEVIESTCICILI